MPKARRPAILDEGSVRPCGGGKKLRFSVNAKPLGFSDVERRKEAAAKATRKTGGGIVFNKTHGQHILRNPLVVNAIVEKAGIKATDIVLEIGPGTGNLTEKLLEVAKRVIAFEIDARMVAELHKRFQNTPLGAKLEVITGNCLQFDFPYFDKCVANVPYSISSPLVFKLLKRPAFKCAVLMLQREFALRVCAKPATEAYCRLSVNCQLLARCSHLMKVGRNSFNPPPKVDSSVIRLDPIHPPPPIDFDEWDGFVKLLFNRKNKKISGIIHTKASFALLYGFHVSYCKMQSTEPMTEAAFKSALDTVLDDPLLEGKRSRCMDQSDIMTALNLFNKAGIHFA